MQYAKHNALLHQLRMQELERRKVEELRDSQPYMNGAGEAEVVHSADLAPLLIAWRKWHDKEYNRDDQSSQVQHATDDPVIGSIQYLSEQTGLNPRRVYEVMHQEQKYVSLTIAEKLLMAIDKEYIIDNGELLIIPNPHWSLKKWTNYMNNSCYQDTDLWG
jgi:hypothetical protein